MYGFKQIISDPSHILPQSSSGIDLICPDQPKYVTDCGTHPSLHPNHHHHPLMSVLFGISKNQVMVLLKKIYELEKKN